MRGSVSLQTGRELDSNLSTTVNRVRRKAQNLKRWNSAIKLELFLRDFFDGLDFVDFIRFMYHIYVYTYTTM